MKIKKKIPKLMSALLAVVMIISSFNMTGHSIIRALEYSGYPTAQ